MHSPLQKTETRREFCKRTQVVFLSVPQIWQRGETPGLGFRHGLQHSNYTWRAPATDKKERPLDYRTQKGFKDDDPERTDFLWANDEKRKRV